MVTIADLEKEIELIKQRNKKVEADKAWETSWSRKVVIAGVTYVGISFFLWGTNFIEPFKAAIVPSIAFVLSTLSIPFFKNIWLKFIYKQSL